jgi:hypothetical protein
VKTVTKVKAMSVLLMAVAAIVGTAGSARAGNVYLTNYYYTYTTSFSTPVYPLGGTCTFSVNAYAFSHTAIQVVATTPAPYDISAGKEHYYIGGPAGPAPNSQLRTDVTYWQVQNTEYTLGVVYDPGYTVLYVLQHPQILTPAQVAQ